MRVIHWRQQNDVIVARVFIMYDWVEIGLNFAESSMRPTRSCESPRIGVRCSGFVGDEDSSLSSAQLWAVSTFLLFKSLEYSFQDYSRCIRECLKMIEDHWGMFVNSYRFFNSFHFGVLCLFFFSGKLLWNSLVFDYQIELEKLIQLF